MRACPRYLEQADKIESALWACRGIRRHSARSCAQVQTFALILEEIAPRRLGAFRQLVQIWRSRCCSERAPRHLQDSGSTHREGPGIPARALPHRAARRLRPLASRTNAPEAAMQTRAVLKGDEWVIQRAQAVHQQRLRCEPLRRLREYEGGRGHAAGHPRASLVPRGTPGFTIARCNETLGGRFMNNGELVFEDMRLPKDHLLVENDALRQDRRSISVPADHPGHRRTSAWASPLSSAPPSTCRTTSSGGRHPDQAPGRRAAPG